MSDSTAQPQANGHAPSRLLITGATGMIGSLLTDHLFRQGNRFAVMQRPGRAAASIAEQPGVTAVEGDFDDPASLHRALEGVDVAFLLTNSTERSEAQQLAFIEAAEAQGVQRVVKLSQLAASVESRVRFLRYHAVVEAALQRSSMEWTFVRPNLILQAYVPFASAIAHGSLPAPIGDARVSVVDARDIAAVAAAALTDPIHAGQTYTVTGPSAVSHAQIAAAIGAAIKRPLQHARLSAEQFVAIVTEAGMPAWQAEGLAEDYAHYDRGEAATVSTDVKRVTGVDPRSVEDFAHDYAGSFVASR